MMDLTSRIIFGFAVASKDSSLTLKMVFSFGFSWGRWGGLNRNGMIKEKRTHCCRRFFLCNGSGGRCRSCRCNRCSNLLDIQARLYKGHVRHSSGSIKQKTPPTFKAATKSAACSNVSPEISSTMLLIFTSADRFGAAGGGAAPPAGLSAATVVDMHLAGDESDARHL